MFFQQSIDNIILYGLQNCLHRFEFAHLPAAA